MNDAARYGPWALITGASDGIGGALAAKIAAHGINVVLVARNEDRLRSTAEGIRHANSVETLVIAADLADPAAVARVENLTGQLDIGLVVLAAGFGTAGTVLETALTDELDLIAVNVSAVYRLAHTFSVRLASRGRGGLLLFGSIVGWQGVPGQANYAASKAYVQSLAEALHDELAPHGVEVLAVAPGPVASGFGGRAGLSMNSATAPEVVATAALNALGRRSRTVVPGVRGKLLTAALTPLPRGTRSRILGRVIAAMRTLPTSTASPGRDDARSQ
jgi:uncharacterized protein